MLEVTLVCSSQRECNTTQTDGSSSSSARLRRANRADALACVWDVRQVWREILGELVAHDALVVLGKGLGAFEVTVRGAPLPPCCCAWRAPQAHLLLSPAFVLLPLPAIVFPAPALRAARTRA
jgi:hypothetical protein